MQSDPSPRLAYGIDELAVLAGCGRDAIYGAIREKRLVARKLGKRTLIPIDEARRFISELPALELPQAGSSK